MGVTRIRDEMLKITVRFQRRDDGGLRAWSDDVPGFVLSHPDADAVLADVEPALETILSEMYGARVTVAPLAEPAEFARSRAGKGARRVTPERREYASQLAA